MERRSVRGAAGLALLAALGAAGCPAERPTVQLVIRAEPGVAEQLESVRVQVTASHATDAGLELCIPCERTFPRVGDAVPMPIVIDYVRGALPVDEAHFILTYVATDGTVRRAYHSFRWPEAGVQSFDVLLEDACMRQLCPPGPGRTCQDVACLPADCPRTCHCIGGSCFEPGVPVEVLTESWRTPGTPPCSSSCAAGTDADADADGTGEADGRSDGDAYEVSESDGPSMEDGVPPDFAPADGGGG